MFQRKLFLLIYVKTIQKLEHKKKLEDQKYLDKRKN